MKIMAMFFQNPAGFLAALLLLIFSAIGFAIDSKTAFLFLTAFIIVLIADILYAVSFLKSTRQYVKYINKSLSNEDREAIETFSLPSVMCDMRGNVVWYNNLFSENIATENVKKLKMNDFFADFKYSKYASLKTAPAEFNGRKYITFITRIKTSSEPMLCFYFHDETLLKNTQVEYELSRPFAMFILIDNIEQLSRQLTDSKFALVSSSIESKIEKWLKNENVIFKKTGNGSFLVIGEKRNLDKLCLGKFSVLNDVRNYKFNNTPIFATLSIGVGTGENFELCESRAKKALDMSLGRGGDQAAVYTDNGYIYFGGLSGRANDNSKVSPRQTAANLSMLIKKYKRVVIVGHKFSDYDAIGSAMGVHHFAEANGIPAYVAVDKKTTLASALVSFAEENDFDGFISTEEALDMCDDDTALVVVDTHRLYLLDVPEIYEKAGAKIVIDHHRRSDDFINDSDIFYHLPSPSSTCEMVAELIEYSTIQEDLPDVIASALLAGIVLDTKDYVLRTSQRTFEAAAFLRENGADTVEVKKLFAVSTDMITVKNEIISSAEIYDNCMIAKTESNDKNIRVITSKAADEMLNVDGVKASFVISYIGKQGVQISARSLGEENVQLIMEQLGGGGHSTMAACQIADVDLDTAHQKLIKAINDYYLMK